MATTHDDKLQAFAELISAQTRDRYAEDYPKMQDVIVDRDCEVQLVHGRKYTKVNVGRSGRLMVDKDGNIFGIKAYGAIHKGHHYGTLDTIADFYWGGYSPVCLPAKKVEATPEPTPPEITSVNLPPSGHVPGPWVLAIDKRYKGKLGDWRYHIRSANPHGVSVTHGVHIATLNQWLREVNETATLIAAAPDLLEAAYAMRDILWAIQERIRTGPPLTREESLELVEPIRMQGVAAIRKATGEKNTTDKAGSDR